MGDFWALMFVAGLVVRPVLILLSFAIVIYLGLRISSLETRSKATLIWVVSHVVLVVGSGIAAELAAAWSGRIVPWAWLPLAAAFVAPIVLWRRLRKHLVGPQASIESGFARDGHERPEFDHTTASETDAPAGLTGSEEKSATRIAWVIGVTGTLAPWLVGLGVKFYLQSIGRPTLPVSSFLDPVALPVLVAATVAMWSFPFLILALVARFWLLVQDKPAGSFRQRVWLVWLIYGFGMAAALPIFVSVFWEFDTLYLFMPIGLFICPFMVLGFGAGLLMIRRAWARG